MRSTISDAPRAATERIASGLMLFAAFASFVLSVSLWFTGNELEGIFVGIWVPSILSFGTLIRLERGQR